MEDITMSTHMYTLTCWKLEVRYRSKVGRKDRSMVGSKHRRMVISKDRS